MKDVAIKPLPHPVSVRIRVDGTPVAVVKTSNVGLRQALLPIEELPLTENSFAELEFFDGADRLIIPARVSAVGDAELTMDYEQTGEIFEHWINTQLKR